MLYLIIALERIAGILWYNLRFADSDQTILWAMAHDLKKGEFHGLCFYGQSYNAALEAFLALPLLIAGLPYPLSFALITSSLAVVPYFLFSSIIRGKWGNDLGIIPLFILTILPPEFLILSSISRGFVTGIAFMSFALFIWEKKDNPFWLLGSGLCISLAIFCNPNSILLLPLFLIFGPPKIHEILNKFIYLIPGTFIGLSIFWINSLYYNNHPGYAFHPNPELKFSLESFFLIVGSLDNYFTIISPGIWKFGWVTLPLFGWLLWSGFERSKLPVKLGIAGITGILAGSFFLIKTTDATNSVYFSGSRMYLSWPLLFASLICLFFIRRTDLKYWTKWIIPIALLSLVIQSIGMPFFIRQSHGGSKNSVVHVFNHKVLSLQCALLYRMAKAQNLQVIIGNSGDTSNQPLAYGCPCLFPDFPLIVLNDYERRPWLLPQTSKGPGKLIYDNTWEGWKTSGMSAIQRPGIDPPQWFGVRTEN